MLCSKLATRGDGVSFPCGQCLNCRINRRRDWQARLLLEASAHDYAAFATFTFRDVGTPQFLRRSDVRFIVRGLLEQVDYLRYFAAAEYGEKTGRAHYHFHLFSRQPLLDRHYVTAWPFGHVHVGECEPASLDYTLGYLLKARAELRWEIEKRYPEFRSFSKGIGRSAFDALTVSGLLPREFRVFGRRWPIGRYFRDLAKSKGIVVDERQEVKLEKLEVAAMRDMLGRPSLSETEVAALYDEFLARRQEKQKVARAKAIRDAYRQDHGHSLKRKPNETF